MKSSASTMRLLLRIGILICCTCTALLGLALFIAHRLPPSNTILAFTTHCDQDTLVYFYDWSNGARLRIFESSRRLASTPNLLSGNWRIAYKMPEPGNPNSVYIGDLISEMDQSPISLPNEERVRTDPPPVWSPDG